jgi:hypothetical protein
MLKNEHNRWGGWIPGNTKPIKTMSQSKRDNSRPMDSKDIGSLIKQFSQESPGSDGYMGILPNI